MFQECLLSWTFSTFIICPEYDAYKSMVEGPNEISVQVYTVINLFDFHVDCLFEEESNVILRGGV